MEEGKGERLEGEERDWRELGRGHVMLEGESRDMRWEGRWKGREWRERE